MQVGGDSHTFWLREAVESAGVTTRVLGRHSKGESGLHHIRLAGKHCLKAVSALVHAAHHQRQID